MALLQPGVQPSTPHGEGVFRHVYANRSNVGDWLSAKGIAHLLGNPPIEEHLCDEPFVEDTLRALRGAGPDDLTVIGGGGLLMDYFTPLWRGLLELPALRLVIWGIGVVDHKKGHSLPPLHIVREVMDRALVCRVRDRHTHDLLAMGSLAEPVPCPSLAVVPRRPASSSGILHAANLDLVGGETYRAMRRLLQEHAARAGTKYHESNNRIHPGRTSELEAVLSLYEKCDVVVSSRLHGCLLAIGMGRPVLAISGDRKVESTMAAAGLSDWVLDPGDLEQLPSRLQEISSQPTTHSYREEAIRSNQEVAEEVIGLGVPT